MNQHNSIKNTASADSGLDLNNLSGLAAEYDSYDALGLAELIAKKEITPIELLDAVRQRVEAINPQINAFSQLFFDKAEASINDGLPDGPFHGVPFALKDLGQYLRGTITTAGSRVWKDDMAEYDSTLVARYKRAGLVIFGKTTTPELGLTTSTESVLFGETHNPWDLDSVRAGVHRVDLQPQWRRASCQPRTPAMVEDRYAFPLRAVACSA